MTQRKPNLRSVREVVPSLQFRTVHGYRRAFRIAGSGPVILLIHGIGDNSTTWETVQAKLAQRFTVIAVDLLGHGQSDKPRADYSIAAYANGMRDLLSVLDIERATVVGHSLGGGVAMQFAYQFPQLVERLVLVGAGGVTKDVNIVLRLAALPMGSEALALLRLPLVLPALQLVGRAAGMVFGSTALGHDLPDVLRVLADLPEPMASAAFTRTLRAVVDWRGQMRHHAGSMLFDGIRSGANHLGHRRCGGPRQPRPDGARRDAGFPIGDFRALRAFPVPRRSRPFHRGRQRFIDTTEPAEYDQVALRELLRTGGGAQTVSGPVDTRVAVLKAMGSDERSAT